MTEDDIDLNVPQQHFLESLDLWQQDLFAKLIESLRTKYPGAKLPPESQRYLLSLLHDSDEFRKIYDYWKHELAKTGQQTRKAYTSTESHRHKVEFQKLVQEHLPDISTLGDLKRNPAFAFYVRSYRGKDTLRGWFNEIAPGHLKRGRPPNTPSSD